MFYVCVKLPFFTARLSGLHRISVGSMIDNMVQKEVNEHELKAHRIESGEANGRP